MTIDSTRSPQLPGVFVPKRYVDDRGWFSETYHQRRLRDIGINHPFVQDNQSNSKRAGTLRGFHFQRPPAAQAKLVSVLRGRVLDVAVDLRRGSPSYGNYVSIELSAEGGEQLYIPTGFAHGFITLEDDVVVMYKTSDYYAPSHEAGICWNDPDIGFSWPFKDADIIKSEKDGQLPRLKDFESPFPYEGQPLGTSMIPETRITTKDLFMRIVVTGGAGFIGSALVRHLIDHTDHDVLVVDKLTYAGNLSSLDSVQGHPRCRFSCTDICDRATIAELFGGFDPDAVMHLAAESHVDRSIDRPADFINTNVVGTYVLLEAALAHWRQLGERAKDFRFLHVSTDEVYGALTGEGHFTEESRYDPRSPYSATKAASDHLVRAWGHTFGLPILLTNCSNNYGPRQFPEKLIPMMVIKGLAHEPMPVYGRGLNVRDWLFVDDHARALTLVLERGRVGETYAIGGNAERRNIDVVGAICDAMDRLVPPKGLSSYHELISFVLDRPGHDFRYAIDFTKLKTELGWSPQHSFETGLASTVQWYIESQAWWQPLLSEHEAGLRRGLAKMRA